MTPITSSSSPELRDKILLPGDGRSRLPRSTYTTVAGPATVLLPETTAQVSRHRGKRRQLRGSLGPGFDRIEFGQPVGE